MAILGSFIKQPNEVLDYDIDFSSFLTAPDVLSSVVSTVTPAGVTLVSNALINGNKGVKQWISGGTAGNTYKIQVSATTVAGRVKEAEFKVKIKEY